MIDGKEFIDYAKILSKVIHEGNTHYVNDKIKIKCANNNAEIDVDGLTYNITVASKQPYYSIEVYELGIPTDPHSANKCDVRYEIDPTKITVHLKRDVYLIETKEDLFNVEVLNSNLVLSYDTLIELQEAVKESPLNICMYYVPEEEKLIYEIN